MTLPGEYFEQLYSASPDPWGFAERWYERRKRLLTLALLPQERYGAAFEPGCSIGILTRDLAARCTSVEATDISPRAIATARAALAQQANVHFSCAELPGAWPAKSYDLVVLSELVYYFARDDATQLAARAAAGTQTLLAVHWRHPVADYPLTGDAAQQIVRAAALAAGMTELASHRERDLVAAVWSRDPRSVAEQGGLT